MPIFLAGGRGFTRREGLRRLKERMEKVPGFDDVRYEPSRLRPRGIVANVDVEMFLGTSFPRTQAQMEVHWRPRNQFDVQRVHRVDDAVSFGWHKDDDHPELGTTHFQLNADGETVYKPGHIGIEAPLSFLETCLDRLPEELQETIDY